MEITLLNSVLYAIFLLSLGSFASVFTTRWPQMIQYHITKEAHQVLAQPFHKKPPKSSLFGRSNCPHCLHTLNWKDIFPLLSFILLKGQCRYCKGPISPHYWQLELMFFIAGFPLIWVTDTLFQLILTSLLISALIMAAIIDFRHQLIPNESCAVAIVAAFFLNLGSTNLEASVIGLLCGYFVIYLIQQAYLHLKKVEAIGLGDAKLLAALGAWLYIENLFCVLLYASLLAILYTVTYKRHTDTIPFGPFLTFSGILQFYILQL